ncbi:hypothetical protein BDW22DRAFT_15174 [Trametopsis cervina]|nr:hypothetical protein BDW22DRAFT_15174 [Trametopsis cervina]
MSASVRGIRVRSCRPRSVFPSGWGRWGWWREERGRGRELTGEQTEEINNKRDVCQIDVPGRIERQRKGNVVRCIAATDARESPIESLMVRSLDPNISLLDMAHRPRPQRAAPCTPHPRRRTRRKRAPNQVTHNAQQPVPQPAPRAATHDVVTLPVRVLPLSRTRLVAA